MQLKSGLYIVSGPVGNLQDITLRAISTLQHSDIILCEDTRVSRKLLTKYAISSSLQVYNDHSTVKDREKIYSLIKQGKVVSIISDAGTPLISDPGYKLVRFLKENHCSVISIPGPCSLIAALTTSGLPSDQFYFGGFIPKTHEAKRLLFKGLASLSATAIFFETAARLLDSLKIVNEVLGNREVSVARELTKLHEEVKLSRCSDLVSYYEQNYIKGELVLLISGATEKLPQDEAKAKLHAKLVKYLDLGCSAKIATAIAFDEFKDIFGKQEIYKIANHIKQGDI